VYILVAVRLCFIYACMA